MRFHYFIIYLIQKFIKGSRLTQDRVVLKVNAGLQDMNKKGDG